MCGYCSWTIAFVITEHSIRVGNTGFQQNLDSGHFYTMKLSRFVTNNELRNSLGTSLEGQKLTDRSWWQNGHQKFCFDEKNSFSKLKIWFYASSLISRRKQEPFGSRFYLILSISHVVFQKSMRTMFCTIAKYEFLYGSSVIITDFVPHVSNGPFYAKILIAVAWQSLGICNIDGLKMMGHLGRGEGPCECGLDPLVSIECGLGMYAGPIRSFSYRERSASNLRERSLAERMTTWLNIHYTNIEFVPPSS